MTGGLLLNLLFYYGLFSLKEGSEIAQSLKGTQLIFDLLLKHIYFFINNIDLVISSSREVFYLCLETNMLRTHSSYVFSLGKMGVVWKPPSKDFKSTLIEDQIEIGFFHFEYVLVVEVGVVDVGDRDGRQFCGLDAVLYGRVFGEVGMHGDAIDFKKDERFGSFFAIPNLLMKHGNFFLIPNKANL